MPVRAIDGGPQTFGHWVSAPDFARSLRRFIDQDPVSGDLACAVLWSDEGAYVEGQEVDDQTFADYEPEAEPSTWEKRALVDCANGWRVNNNHFGDFAARHYIYYHQLAVEAARRYRSTRQESCYEAAYTLEAWGQHYLSDTPAAGHAWNPPGSYDHQWGFVTWTGPVIRMRIHDHLNENGARMAGAFYNDERFWGDHSAEYSGSGSSMTERVGHAQRELTIRLGRMGLGQVAATAECGGDPDHWRVFSSTDEAIDPRRVYVSNWSMCKAMYGREIWSFVPNSVNIWGVQHEALRELVQACKDDRGDLQLNPAGQELAAMYFLDRMGEFEDPAMPLTVDPEAEMSLEDLGCRADSEPAPLASAGALDICGNSLCEVPMSADGHCPAGTEATGGCCFSVPSYDEEGGGAEIQTWSFVPEASGATHLAAPGAVRGEESQFLWFPNHAVGASAARDWMDLSGVAAQDPVSLTGRDETIDACSSEGSFSVFETRVKIPRTVELSRKVAVLRVLGMDEGLKVQVNGHVVGYANEEDLAEQGSLTIPLTTNAAPPVADGTYVVRLTHLNDCSRERPLVVAVLLDDKADGVGVETVEQEAGACRVSPHSRHSSSALWGLLGLLALGGVSLFRRRQAI